MLPINISYPLFEANQVLSNEHLNQLFNYLHEQERLSRTNLIGIGIVCGLEPSIAESGDQIFLSKGCGVTSEGYLITWGTQAALEWYRPYSVPDAIPYREFGSGSNPFTPFPMWELMPDRNNDPAAVRISRDFLQGNNQLPGEGDEKILVLFLECEAESNRNCTPNSCNDKGTTVTATVRPLLIRKQDIDLLQARIRALGPQAEAYFSLADSMSNRLNLPTLKLPRFDVAATNLGSTSSVFSAFQLAMSKPVVEGLANALGAAYQAFAPLLKAYPANPFSNLDTNWAYLHDGSIESSGQYLWYQYFYDHLDIVMQAYEEFRLRGLEVLGLCCPDSRLFKRHLFVGNLGVEPIDGSYRHSFVPSPLFTRQQGALSELRLLFDRLVSLVQGLELPPNVSNFISINPGLLPNFTVGFQPGVFTPITNINPLTINRPNIFTTFRPRLSTSIKITPSRLGGPLSQKAIPYHYRPVPLYEQWSYHLTRQSKAQLNLGYRSGAWNTTDLFIRFPLQYDLEPHNFLRIEGHIGQNYVQVLNELLLQKDRSRLPIDIVALKSGFSADSIPLPTEIAECHFQDLESLYHAFREEQLCQICETIKRFYQTPILPSETKPSFLGNRVPQLSFLQQCAPNFRYSDDTIGAFYEDNLNLHTGSAPYLGNLAPSYVYHVLFIFHLVKLSGLVPENVSALDMDAFRQQHNTLMGFMQLINSYLLQQTNDALSDSDNGNSDMLDMEEFSDQLDMILFACKLESFQRIFDEYQDRVEKIREGLLFAHFADKHPGLQHKAGVPMGGTFVMVYHGEDQPDDVPTQEGSFTIRGRVVANGEPIVGASIIQVGATAGALTSLDGRFSIMVSSLPARLQVIMAGFESREIIAVREILSNDIDLAVPPEGDSDLGRFADLAVGTIIADFYLPYLCCSDCAPVQFVLPKEPPTFSWEQVGCTTPNLTGQILITPAGGVPPYDYSIDGGISWNQLGADPIDVQNSVQVQIRDAEGTISIRRTVELLPPLVIDAGAGECEDDGLHFRVRVDIDGGQPPYRVIANGQTYEVPLGDNTGFATFPSGQGGEVVVQDSSDPPCEQRFTAAAVTCEEACDLPCNGMTRECGHPFWIQRNPNNQVSYQEVVLTVNAFNVVDDQTGQVFTFNTDQLGTLSEILSPNGDLASASVFTSFWKDRMPQANEYIQSLLGDFFKSPENPVIQLSYNPTNNKNFTTLRIEHYDCHTYFLEIQVKFSGVSPGKHDYDRTWIYTDKESRVTDLAIRNGEEEFMGRGGLPAFNCILRDRCNPENPDQLLCEEPKGFDIDIEQLSEGFTLFSNNAGSRSVLWMVEYALPAIANGSQAEVRIDINFAKRYTVRAIAVDSDTTCATGAQKNINL